MTQTPYQAGAPLSTGHYEFNETENTTISDVGARAKIWGIMSIVTGALALVGLVIALYFKEELVLHGLPANYITIFVVSLLPIVLTHLVIAMLYIGAGNSLQAVVHTQGNDVEHLMQSLHKLGTAFLVEFAIGTIAVIGGGIVGWQMALENHEAQKAADAERSAAAAAALEQDEDEGDTDDEGSGGEDEEDDAGEEDAEGAEAEGDTDGAEGDEDEASGGAAEGEEGEDAEDGEEAEDAGAEEAAEPTAEAPVAG